MGNFFRYLFQQIILRIGFFLKNWFFDAFLVFWQRLLKILESLDKVFAIKITFRHWLKPLYQDRTIVGYSLGFIFRTLRIILAGFFYVLIFLIVIFLYLLWAGLPLYLIYKFLA